MNDTGLILLSQLVVFLATMLFILAVRDDVRKLRRSVIRGRKRLRRTTDQETP